MSSILSQVVTFVKLSYRLEDMMPTIREPRYRKIAYQIAQKIADNNYPVGSKLHARSTLSAAFGVSSETARKAISVLADLSNQSMAVVLKSCHGKKLKSF